MGNYSPEHVFLQAISIDSVSVSNSMTAKDSTNIRVLIVDDQTFVQEILKAYLVDDPSIQVVATAKSAQSALAQIETHHPDIALVDIEMPEVDGLTAAKAMLERFPHIKVLILSSYNDFSYINRALQIGVKGYLDKATPPTELIDAIHSVHKGYFQLGPGLLEQVLQTIAVENANEPISSVSDNSDRLHVLEVLSGQLVEQQKILQNKVKQQQSKLDSDNLDLLREKSIQFEQQLLGFEQQLSNSFARILHLERTTRKMWVALGGLGLLGMIYVSQLLLRGY